MSRIIFFEQYSPVIGVSRKSNTHHVPCFALVPVGMRPYLRERWQHSTLCFQRHFERKLIMLTGRFDVIRHGKCPIAIIKRRDENEIIEVELIAQMECKLANDARVRDL